MKKLPQVTVKFLAQELAVSEPTVRAALNHMLTLVILQETSGKRRDRVYVYRAYLEMLEAGAEPL
jgi:Fic family protein